MWNARLRYETGCFRDSPSVNVICWGKSMIWIIIVTILLFLFVFFTFIPCFFHPISWPLLFSFFGQSRVLPLRDTFLTLRLPICPSPFQRVFVRRDLFSQFVLGFCYRISLLHAIGENTPSVCPINDTCSAPTILFNFFTLIFGWDCKF
jgi:hypothetical protein